MSALALSGRPATARRGEAARWGACFALVLGLHAAGVAFLLANRSLTIEPGEALPAVLVDLAPQPSAPAVAPNDTPPSETGPEMTAPDPVAEAPPALPIPDATPPDPPPVLKTETPPDPVPPRAQPRAAVALPAPQPLAKPIPKPKPIERVVERKPPKPVQARRGERSEERRPPAQESGAQSTASISTSNGASAASRASWQGALVAHLRRYLQPQNGQTGSASVRFTMTRSGSVTSTSLVGSAGSAVLDSEALAVVRRSQPLPAAPSDVPGSTFTFTIPVRFTAR